MERIVRSEDDIYMLYTGGTTGMPKGVMYDMASHVSAVPAIRLPVPRSTGAADRRRGRTARRSRSPTAGNRMVAIPCAPLMHGTGLWLGAFAAHLTGGEVITLTSRTLDAARGAAHRAGPTGDVAGDRRRRLRQADGRRHRRGRASAASRTTCRASA